MLVETILDSAIFLRDTQGGVIRWTAGAERIKGHNFDEIRRRHFSVFYPAEDTGRKKPACEPKVAAHLTSCSVRSTQTARAVMMDLNGGAKIESEPADGLIRAIEAVPLPGAQVILAVISAIITDSIVATVARFSRI